MKAEVLHRFTVEGHNLFPFDMLRYDQCFPEKESPDSYNIELTTCFRKEAVRVTLLGMRPPTDARWRSFGWSVVPESVEKVRR